MLFFVSCSSNNNRYKKSSEAIKKSSKVNAQFYVGGFGQGYHVKITNNILSYLDDGYSTNIKHKQWVKRKLAKNEIKNLEKMFIYYDVQEWDKSYNIPWMQDGTQWFIKYKSPTLSINSEGSNAYPSDYNKVLKYISQELLRGKNFH
jgi:hypothetical protein